MNIQTENLKKAIGSREESRQTGSFGDLVFGRRLIEQSLPKKQASNWLAAMEGREKIEKENLDAIAEALKEWALSHGATHYTHWFQPQTGLGAEKHDAFLAWGKDGVIDQFRGKDLLQGEPDASSFPNGGLRCTSEARGYTLWDPTTPPFLWEEGDGVTLCIPTLFFSWKGDALDFKIPLLRAEQKLQEAALRLLKIAGIDAKGAHSTLGAEQEYFLLERGDYLARPDLLLTGRTLYGARPAKGQELEDHYFGAIHERFLSFMRDFEEAALRLGIPLKTRHNEVAPSQCEAAPLFEKTPLAADHNLLLMQLMNKLAEQHNLACLFHEKPFKYCNGSGKHCNWSIATDTGLNLLDPKEDNFVFLTLLTAVLRAVHEHAALLRAGIASCRNDCRLGGSEAPPTILSVYLGDALQAMVDKIIHGESSMVRLSAIDLGLSHIALHIPDSSDRNRTSFFAFTGNKFEFRAVGASAHVAWPMTLVNAIVADSLHLLLDEIEDARANSKSGDLLAQALPALRKHLQKASPVIFGGNNYSREWEEEAKQRGLPNIRRSFHAYSELQTPKTARVLQGVFKKAELHGRYEVLIEQYAKQMNIECNLMIEIFRTQILPAALEQQKRWAKSVLLLNDLKIHGEMQHKELVFYSDLINDALEKVRELEKIHNQTDDLRIEARAKVFCELVLDRMEKAREAVDRLEGWVDDSLWPLPKTREMLFR